MITTYGWALQPPPLSPEFSIQDMGGQGLGTCISNTLPNKGAVAAGLGPHTLSTSHWLQSISAKNARSLFSNTRLMHFGELEQRPGADGVLQPRWTGEAQEGHITHLCLPCPLSGVYLCFHASQSTPFPGDTRDPP